MEEKIMKKSIFTSVVFAFGILLAAVAICPTVFASVEKQPETLHEKIEQQLTSIEGIKESRVFVYEDCALVAIRTQNVTNKTENDKIEQSVKEFLAKEYPQYKNVLVTSSMKIFVAIERLNYMVDTGKTDIEDLKDKFPRPMPKPGLEPKQETSGN